MNNYSSFGLCRDTSAHKARPSFQDKSRFCTVKILLKGDSLSWYQAKRLSVSRLQATIWKRTNEALWLKIKHQQQARTVGNLAISEPSLGILKKFPHSSDPPYVKYNYAVLFLRQICSLFFMLQNIVLIDHLCKTSIRNF